MNCDGKLRWKLVSREYPFGKTSSIFFLLKITNLAFQIQFLDEFFRDIVGAIS